MNTVTEADYETLLPAGCAVHVLATPAEDAAGTLALLAEAVGAGTIELPSESYAPFAPPTLPDEPGVPLTPRSIGQAVSALLPHDAIVVDEAITAAGGFWEHSGNAAGHDVLAVTGGSIGIGLPLAVGAAVACRNYTSNPSVASQCN